MVPHEITIDATTLRSAAIMAQNETVYARTIKGHKGDAVLPRVLFIEEKPEGEHT